MWAWAPAALSCPAPLQKAHGVTLTSKHEETIWAVSLLQAGCASSSRRAMFPPPAGLCPASSWAVNPPPGGLCPLL